MNIPRNRKERKGRRERGIVVEIVNKNPDLTILVDKTVTRLLAQKTKEAKPMSKTEITIDMNELLNLLNTINENTERFYRQRVALDAEPDPASELTGFHVRKAVTEVIEAVCDLTGLDPASLRPSLLDK